MQIELSRLCARPSSMKMPMPNSSENLRKRFRNSESYLSRRGLKFTKVRDCFTMNY